MSALTDTVVATLADPKFQGLSAPAAGLWLKMLSLLDNSERRGFLQLNGKPLSVETLAWHGKVSTDVAAVCLTEILHSGAGCRGDDGIYFCRKLRDALARESRQLQEERRALEEEAERVRLQRSDAGKRSAAARAAARAAAPGIDTIPTKSNDRSTTVQRPLNGRWPSVAALSDGTAKPALSSADPPETRISAPVLYSSSSLLPEKEEKKSQYIHTSGGGPGEGGKKRGGPPPLPPALDTPRFRAIWERWLKHLREKRVPLTATAAEAQLVSLTVWGEARAFAAVEYSILRNWKSVYEEEEPKFFARSDTNAQRPTKAVPRCPSGPGDGVSPPATPRDQPDAGGAPGA